MIRGPSQAEQGLLEEPPHRRGMPTPTQETTMASDTVCTLVPYFKVKPGQLAAFKAGVAGFVERT